MAAETVTALGVGSFFIGKYYQILKESPQYSHQFYNDTSIMTRVDGDDTQTASNIMDIHSLLTSLNVTGVEVEKLNCQDSWKDGLLLIVSGLLRSRNFSGKRKFTQAFFLAPQEQGYFVLNDVLHLDDEVIVNQHPVPEIPEIKVDSEVHASSPHLEQPVSNYELEEESRDYVNSLHIEEDSPVDKYSLPDEQQYEEPEPELETVVKEAPVEEAPPLESSMNHVNHVEESIPVPVNEPAGEPAKLSYASILRASKGQPAQQAGPKPAVRQSMPSPPEQHQRVQTAAPQLNPSASSFVPEAAGAGTDDALAHEEGELPSVYVKNLPSNVTSADLEKEFKKFGRIVPNGVFIRNKKDIGVCFAFVEFEDMSGVHNAIKASPIELLGRQIYIEERRASSNNSSRGGVAPRGRGRGRSSYQNETSRGRGGARNPGRGILDDYNRSRGSNGFQQRTSR